MTKRRVALGLIDARRRRARQTGQTLARPWRHPAPMLLLTRQVDSWRTSAVRSALQGHLSGDAARLVTSGVTLGMDRDAGQGLGNA